MKKSEQMWLDFFDSYSAFPKKQILILIAL